MTDAIKEAARLIGRQPFRETAGQLNQFGAGEIPSVTEQLIIFGEQLQKRGMFFNVDRMAWSLKGKADCWADLEGENGNVRLRAMWVPETKRDHGYSKMILRALTTAADDTLTTLLLVVRPFDMVGKELVPDKVAEGGLTEAELIELYSGFGWQLYDDPTTTRPAMKRVPNANQN